MNSSIGDMFDTLSLIVEKLDSIDIPYMLSGSVAATLYAEPRFTNDIDIVIQTSRSKKTELYTVFKDRFYITEDSIEEAFTAVGMFNIIYQPTVTKCDMILLKDDEFSQNAFSRSSEHIIEGMSKSVRVISLEDLILQKLLWWTEFRSELQWSDLQRLLLARKQNIDMKYLHSWAKKIGVESNLQKLL